MNGIIKRVDFKEKLTLCGETIGAWKRGESFLAPAKQANGDWKFTHKSGLFSIVPWHNIASETYEPETESPTKKVENVVPKAKA